MSVGYENVPVIKCLSIVFFVLTLLLGEHVINFAFDIGHVARGQLWRLFTGQMVFENLTQAFYGLVLLYNLSPFERQLGSRKFASFGALSFVLSMFLALLPVLSAAVGGVRLVPASGPYFLIFALLAFYYKYVPKLQSAEYRLLSVPLSSKTFVYIMALQLMLNRGVSSVVPSLSGLLAGFLYDRNMFSMQSMRLPHAVEVPFRLFNQGVSLFWPSAAAPTVNASGRQPAVGGMRPTAEPTGLRRRHDDHIQEMPDMGPPDEDAVQALMGMGFDRSEVLRSLRECGNNADAAANMLLR